jgi:hypothetical protein
VQQNGNTTTRPDGQHAPASSGGVLKNNEILPNGVFVTLLVTGS